MIKKILIIATIIMAGIETNTVFGQDHSITPDGTYLYAQRDTCDLFMDVDPAEGSTRTISGIE